MELGDTSVQVDALLICTAKAALTQWFEVTGPDAYIEHLRGNLRPEELPRWVVDRVSVERFPDKVFFIELMKSALYLKMADVGIQWEGIYDAAEDLADTKILLGAAGSEAQWLLDAVSLDLIVTILATYFLEPASCLHHSQGTEKNKLLLV